MKCERLLFIHSGEKVKIDYEGNMYTDGSYNDKIWKRYLFFADSIVIAMRRDSSRYSLTEASAKFNPINSEFVSFVELPDSNRSIIDYINPVIRKRREDILQKEIEKADMVIIRMPGTDFALYEAKRQHKPVIVEVVGCPFDALWNHSLKGKFAAIPAMIRLRKSLQKAEYAIYVTDSFLQTRYPTKGKSIGVSDVEIDVADQDVIDRRIKKICATRTDHKIVLGSMGAVNLKYKGHHYVLEAMARLRSTMKDVKFEYQIAGAGSQEYLRAIIRKLNLEKQVVFLGAIPHEKVPEWLDGIDVYIQPSLQEGLPRALIEAMNRALPCIGSNAGGIPELLSAEYICSRRDLSKQLARRIIWLNKTQMEKSAKENFSKSLEYTPDILERKRLGFYDSFCKENKIDEQQIDCH